MDTDTKGPPINMVDPYFLSGLCLSVPLLALYLTNKRHGYKALIYSRGLIRFDLNTASHLCHCHLYEHIHFNYPSWMHVEKIHNGF